MEEYIEIILAVIGGISLLTSLALLIIKGVSKLLPNSQFLTGCDKVLQVAAVVLGILRTALLPTKGTTSDDRPISSDDE